MKQFNQNCVWNVPVAAGDIYKAFGLGLVIMSCFCKPVLALENVFISLDNIKNT